MSNYDNAVVKLLAHEGGYVNNPKDTGGRTNLGITQRVYETFIGKTLVGPKTDAPYGQTMSEAESTMRNMPRGNAVAIYKKEYWDRVLGDKIPQYAIAFTIFDQAVNRGVSSAVKQAQNILGINADGAMGNDTLKSLLAKVSTPDGEKDFLNKYLAASANFYKMIVARDPSQSVFLVGWLKRVDSIKSYVDKNLSTVAKVATSVGAVVILAGSFFLIYRLVKSRMNERQYA